MEEVEGLEEIGERAEVNEALREIAISLYVREPLRVVALPLAATIGKDTGTSDVLSVVERLRELVGGEVLDTLDRVFSEALSDGSSGSSTLMISSMNSLCLSRSSGPGSATPGGAEQ